MASTRSGRRYGCFGLLEKLPDLYGSRFFDVLLLDALYAQAPVFKLAERRGWDLVVSLKQNQRDLYQSAIRLFARRPADGSCAEQHDGKSYQFQLWDAEGLPFSTEHRSCGPKRSSHRTITAGASLNLKRPSTNSSGLRLWISRPFPPRWCAGSAMTAGNRRTTVGTI